MNLQALSPEARSHLREALITRRREQEEKELCETSLAEFIKRGWRHLDSSEYVDSWHIDAMSEHLEAVSRGAIKRLLINIPPRHSKTSVCSIAWPAWTWAQESDGILLGPDVSFLCGSYGHILSMQISLKERRLLESDWYQKHWGDRFSFRSDQNTKGQYDNDKGGSRIATSVGGSLLGIGGNIIIIDDPHNTESVESDAERETVLEWWREISTTRLNRPKQDAIVVVMQRLHEDDVSGYILENDKAGEWCHLMLPARHDTQRHCITSIGWEDPRIEEGELLEPGRFGDAELKKIERGLGPYLAAGRLQQAPAPKGGGIIKREWWQLWPPEGEEEIWKKEVRWKDKSGREQITIQPAYPDFEYMIFSGDTAYTEKESNDFSAGVFLGVFKRNGLSRILLVEAWEERLEFNDLLTKIIAGCRRRKVDAVLIEGKASGKSIAQEVKRTCLPEEFMIVEVNPEGDKVARAHATVPLFAAGSIFAPDRSWADNVIKRCEQFPKGKFRDTVDALTQGINYLRKLGLALMPEESQREELAANTFQSHYDSEPLYPV